MRLFDKLLKQRKTSLLSEDGTKLLREFLDSESTGQLTVEGVTCLKIPPPQPIQSEWLEIHNSEIESVWVLKKDVCIISTDPMGVEVCIVVGNAPLPYKTRSIDSAETILGKLYGSY